jgi:hypothetical protein
VIVQLLAGSSWPLTAHVVLHGNSATFEFVMAPTATAVVPVFHIVTRTVVLEVVPSAVAGNAVLFHVIVNVDGWIVVGVDVVVEGVVELEQPIAATMISRTGMWAGRTVEYIA